MNNYLKNKKLKTFEAAFNDKSLFGYLILKLNVLLENHIGIKTIKYFMRTKTFNFRGFDSDISKIYYWICFQTCNKIKVIILFNKRYLNFY